MTLEYLKRRARSPALRRSVRFGLDHLPVGRHVALRAARSLDELVSRSDPAHVAVGGRARTVPLSYRISPAPPPIAGAWPEPPLIDHPHKYIRSAAQPVMPTPEQFDADLFEALNTEYEARPLVPRPPGRDAASLSDKARSRLGEIHTSIGLAGQRVLEFGCGSGYEVWYLAHHLGADATGVDIAERRAWSVLTDDRTRFVMADIARERAFPEDHFDRIVSFSVFEHVAHPHATLRELYRILRPGGLAFIMANLHQGPKASHLYNDVYFPWPHLLFQDHAIREYFARRGRKVEGASWVNRLTWSQYENLFQRVGFEFLALRFSESPFDEEFYRRFEGILSRYARWDLSRDFFHVVVRKPG